DPAPAGTAFTLAETGRAADALGVTVQRVDVRSAEDLPHAFDMATRSAAEAMMILSANIFLQLASQITTVAASARLPTAFADREQVVAGGLLSYGANVIDQWRRAAVYVDKVLRGAKPAELPVEQPTTFDLVVNRTTAQLLGITIPPDVAAQVTEWVQ